MPTSRPAPRSPVWTREPTGRRPALTRADIVAAAIRLADAEGLAAVSIRRVATELGARTMSLYTYIESKDDLLDLMGEDAAGEVLLDEPLPTGWREALSLIARRERAVFGRHPWMLDLLGRRPRLGPNILRHLEQSLAAVADLESRPGRALRVLAAVDDYVLGATLREVVHARGADGDRAGRLQPYLDDALASGEFPHLAPLLRDGLPTDVGNFEIGLTWLLDGIAADLVD